MTSDGKPTQTQRTEYLKRLDRWQSWCVFPVVFAGFLFMSRPTSVRAAVLFRLALMVGGSAGYGWLALKKRRGSEPA
jgi:hypothetical protein